MSGPDTGPRALFRSRLFWSGMALKLLLGSLLASTYLRDLFVPFLNHFVDSGLKNPWAHAASLGRLNSFPYPPVMLFVMALPRALLGPMLRGGDDAVTPLHLLAMRLPLLGADVAIAAILAGWFPHRVGRVLRFYWWSPFVLYVSYWHGQLDVIPTALFLGCLDLLRRKRDHAAMVVFGLALASKSHLLVALPFLLTYVAQERGRRRAAGSGLLAIATYAAAVAPYAGDPAFQRMVYGTDEQARLFAFNLPVGGTGLAVLLAPGAIVLLWLRFAAYARRDWDLLMLYLGILFCVFILLAPPAPGYFLWSLPFLVHFLCRSGEARPLPYLAYATGYLAYFWLSRGSDLFDAWRLVSPALAAQPTPYALLSAHSPAAAALAQNLAFTVMQALLAFTALSVYLTGVRTNAVYRMRTRPVLIGVAGDSGAGKDYFSRLLVDGLGADRVTLIAGDDYHHWPRGHEKWRVYTHLDVRSNDLYRQQDHAIALFEGRSVLKGTYDHATGSFTAPRLVDASEYVVFSGLHSLASEHMRGLFDLTVFLDPDESLRRAWKLRRDRDERGHPQEKVLADLEAREPDRQRYVLPQREQAELVVRWQPGPAGAQRQSELELELVASNSFNWTGLVDGLRRVDALRVEHEPFSDTRRQVLRLAGTITPEELRALAHGVVVGLAELAAHPSFAGGLEGCVQLAALACVSEKLRWERTLD